MTDQQRAVLRHGGSLIRHSFLLMLSVTVIGGFGVMFWVWRLGLTLVY
jgi:hypothetical protein